MRSRFPLSSSRRFLVPAALCLASALTAVGCSSTHALAGPASPTSAAVWTGHQLLIWRGWTGSFADQRIPPHGAAYAPPANRWTALPMAPLRGRSAPTAVWTGHQMIVWGGFIPGQKYTYLTDGAAYQPPQMP